MIQNLFSGDPDLELRSDPDLPLGITTGTTAKPPGPLPLFSLAARTA